MDFKHTIMKHKEYVIIALLVLIVIISIRMCNKDMKIEQITENALNTEMQLRSEIQLSQGTIAMLIDQINEQENEIFELENQKEKIKIIYKEKIKLIDGLSYDQTLQSITEQIKIKCEQDFAGKTVINESDTFAVIKKENLQCFLITFAKLDECNQIAVVNDSIIKALNYVIILKDSIISEKDTIIHKEQLISNSCRNNSEQMARERKKWRNISIGAGIFALIAIIF